MRPRGGACKSIHTYTPLHANVKVPRSAPTPRFARKGANPTLETIEYIRAILETSAAPVSRNQVLATLSAWRHGTTRQSLNAAVGFLAADGSVVEGSKGLQWVPEAEGTILETIRRKRTR